MTHTIELGGKARPVLFGNAAFRHLKNDTGLSVTDLLDSIGIGDFSVLADIVYPALRIGERVSNLEPGTYDQMDVAIWIDQTPGSTMQLITWLNESIVALSQGAEDLNETPGEAKKKKPISTGAK